MKTDDKGLFALFRNDPMFAEFRGPRASLLVTALGGLLVIFSCITIEIVNIIVFQMTANTPPDPIIAVIFRYVFGSFLVIGLLVLFGGILKIMLDARANGPLVPPVAPVAHVAPEPPIPVTLTLEQRQNILQGEINAYLGQGYRVISQTDTTAQLIRPKQFSCLLASFFLIFTLGLILILYLFYYLSQKDQALYIEVGVDGKITRR